jgi:hypothetical protein
MIAPLLKGRSVLPWFMGALVMVGATVLARSDGPGPIPGGAQAVGALLLVLGVAFVGIHGLKRWSKVAARPAEGASVPIQVLGVRGLGDGRSLVVVDVEGERFLLSSGRDALKLLARISAPGSHSPKGPIPGGRT